MEFDTKSNLFRWFLKPKDIDLAFKNKNINSELWIVFNFKISKKANEQNMIKLANSSISKIDQLSSSNL